MKITVAEYAGYAKQFNPVKFDADAWVQLAKEAGMKYIVITSKHHDGFAMFQSAASPYNIVDATPFKRLSLGRAAQKPDKLFLSFFYWPKDGTLVVPMRSGAKKAYLLGAMDQSLPMTPSPQGLCLKVPASAPDPVATVIMLEGVGQVAALPRRRSPRSRTAPSRSSATQLICLAGACGSRATRG